MISNEKSDRMIELMDMLESHKSGVTPLPAAKRLEIEHELAGLRLELQVAADRAYAKTDGRLPRK